MSHEQHRQHGRNQPKHALPGSGRPRSTDSTFIRSLEPDEEVWALLIVRSRADAQSLLEVQNLLTTPAHRGKSFLSAAQYVQRFGADQNDIETVLTFADEAELKVLDAHAGRRTVTIMGTAKQIKEVFDVRLCIYESPRPQPFTRAENMEKDDNVGMISHRGFDGQIHLPRSLQNVVVAMVGLDNRPVCIPTGGTGDPSGAVSLGTPAIAQQYNFPDTGAPNQTTAVFAPQTSPGQGASYWKSDINSSYFPSLPAGFQNSPTSINDVNLTVGVNTFQNNPTSVTNITSADLNSPQKFPVPSILELTTDISITSTIAQGVNVNVYFTEDSEAGWLVFLNRILVPGSEAQPFSVTSSWGLYLDDRTLTTITDTNSFGRTIKELFEHIAARGINVFMATGDWGADDSVVDGKAKVQYPASDPSVTACGGTILALPSAANPLPQEVAWSDAHNSGSNFGSKSDFGATGGGASAMFPVPRYQTQAGITKIVDSNGNSLVGRFIPDVAGMVAHTGFFVNAISYSFVGTSCVAPMYAGLAAVLHEAFQLQFGFLNPILYQLGSASFNDTLTGNNDSVDVPDSPFFTAGAGWDAVSGWGSIDGTKLLNGIAQQIFRQSFYLIVDKSTYGIDEAANLPISPNAFFIVLEGFAPFSLPVGVKPSLIGSFDAPGIIDITIADPIFEVNSAPTTPQRVTWPCVVTFTSSAVQTVNNGGIFPEPGTASVFRPLGATFSILGQTFAAVALFELVGGANPFFMNVIPSTNNPFFLSQDLRVFTATQFPNPSNIPVPGGPQFITSPTTGPFDREAKAGFTYIQALLKWLNQNFSNPQGQDPFTTILPNQSGALFGDSFVQPDAEVPQMPDGPRYPNYPFAIARVRLNGTPGRSTNGNVRVFFRLFITQTSDTDYDPIKTYPSDPDAAGLPGNPTQGLQDTTIPFFATGNLTSNADFAEQLDYAGNTINDQPIIIGSNGEVWAYYGCFLNLYAEGNTVSGKPIFQHLIGTHNCLVAQIAFDETPIPISQQGATTSPASSDKLAQRNLQVTVSDNPGPPSTHRIPQTFDVRPSAPLSTNSGDLLDYPDELIIDWGNTPPGSMAYFYWPAADIDTVLSLAQRLYSTNQLSAASDPSTIQCTVPNGQTYIPIAPSTSTPPTNFAGLLTIDLPQGIVQGEEFLITIRRVATRQPPPAVSVPKILHAPMARVSRKIESESRGRPRFMNNWRYTVGSFAIKIPVTTKDVMLRPEERTLAIMKWRLAGLDPANRWWPVLDRYIQVLSGRVDGLGGNASEIPADPGWGSSGGEYGNRDCEVCGRVVGVSYDGCGKFDGFLFRATAIESLRDKLGMRSREYRHLRSRGSAGVHGTKARSELVTLAVRIDSSCGCGCGCNGHDNLAEVVKEAWEKRILLCIWVKRSKARNLTLSCERGIVMRSVLREHELCDCCSTNDDKCEQGREGNRT